MISGTVHFWHWLELLYALERVGYDGWLGGDVTSKHIGPVEAFDTNIRMIRRMVKVLDRLGLDRITDLMSKDGSIAEIFNYLSQGLVQEK